MTQKIVLQLEITGAEIGLADYNQDEFVEDAREAVLIDLDVYREGSVTLEELAHGYGGELKVKLVSVTEEETTKEKNE